MAYSFNGTSQYLTTSTSPISGVPLTIACWAKLNSLSGAPNLLNVQGADLLSASFMLAIRPADLTLRFYTSGVSTLQSTVATTGRWFHAAGVAASATSRTVYYDGTSTGTSTTSVTNQPLTRVVIGAEFSGGAWGAFANGSITECGVWSAALTADEIRSLSKGVTCDQIRPQSLVFYAPLISDLVDVRGGLTITNNGGATAADHPRVYA